MQTSLPSYSLDLQEAQEVQDLQEFQEVQGLQEVQEVQDLQGVQEVQDLQEVEDLQEVQEVQVLEEDQEVEGCRRSAVPVHLQAESSDFLSDWTSTSFLPEPRVQRLTASELLRNR